MTALREALAHATARLAAAGIESARWDAEQLAAHVLGVPRAALVSATAIDTGAYDAVVARRAAREPLQHIVGTVGFRYVDLAVGSGVFIPRPETESVAGYAIDVARRLSNPRVVDLCAGSGAIALSVAHEVPDADVHAVEVDDNALEWLRRNASGTRVTVHHDDVAHALPDLDGTVDVVVSNPPYVAEHELVHVEPEVRDHDPHRALVAGGDGLDVIRLVERTAHRLLKDGGVVVVEHSDRQGESAPAVFARWADVKDHDDLTGRPRYTTARKMVP